MKNAKKIALLIVQMIAVVAVVAIFFSIQNKQLKPTIVYQYARDLSATSVINSSDIREVQIPGDAVTDKMVLDPNLIVGKAVESDVYESDYVTSSVLIEQAEIDPFETMDLSDYRQIALEVSRQSAVGGNLESGDTVDLSYVAKASAREDEENYSFTYAKVFMEDVLIYKVLTSNGSEYINQTDGPVYNPDGSQVSSTPGIVILAVTADQAEEILARMSTGTVQLVGRFDDSMNSDTTGYVMGDYGKVYTYYANPEE